MSDISLDWGPLDIAFLALIIGAPGLIIGAALGAIMWRRRRILGAVIGALLGLFLWLGGFVLWKSSPWS
jgi:Na+/proline symporter